MEISTTDVQTLFAGGRLCLDFVNTSCKRRGADVEFIRNGDELRYWLHLAESTLGKPLSPPDAVWSAGYADSALPAAIELRAALRDLVQSVIEKEPVPAAALATVNGVLRANPTYSRIENSPTGFEESAEFCHPDGGWMVAIATDAVDLLCHSDLSLLRQCECTTCVRVFYDTTKNHRRRWCVEKCSSQTKAAAYYRRKKVRSLTAGTASENDTK